VNFCKFSISAIKKYAVKCIIMVHHNVKLWSLDLEMALRVFGVTTTCTTDLNFQLHIACCSCITNPDESDGHWTDIQKRQHVMRSYSGRTANFTVNDDQSIKQYLLRRQWQNRVNVSMIWRRERWLFHLGHSELFVLKHGVGFIVSLLLSSAELQHETSVKCTTVKAKPCGVLNEVVFLHIIGPKSQFLCQLQSITPK